MEENAPHPQRKPPVATSDFRSLRISAPFLAVLEGETQHLAGVLELEFAHEIRAVRIDRFRADMQLLSYLAAALDLADQLQDFELAVGQIGQGAAIGVESPSHVGFKELGS